jgi:hypothetical protein
VHEYEAREGPADFEADFAASDIFRSGSYIQPVWRGAAFEGHYFAEEGTDVGYAGASWAWRTHGLKLSPGLGIVFGSDGFTTSPAVSIRWDFERSWFVSQGLILQGFRETTAASEGEESAQSAEAAGRAVFHPAISDGNHVSARWNRLTAGGTWEHIHFREGDEWKGGGRVAFRILPHVSGVLMVLGPGHVEWRGGIAIHPRQEH